MLLNSILSNFGFVKIIFFDFNLGEYKIQPN